MSKDETIKKPELASHSLIHFLDKFVYKKPKSSTRTHGQSIMQPMASSGEGEAGLIWGQKVSGILPDPVNSQSFRDTKSSDVAAEDAFFHHYFSRAGKAPGSRKVDDSATDPAIDRASIGEEDEEEVLRALVSTHDGLPDEGDSSGAEFDYSDDDDEAADDTSPAERVEDEDSEMGDIDALIGSELDSAEDEDEASAEESEGAVDAAADDRRQRRKLLKSLKNAPVFAFADEYEGMLADEHDN